MAYTPEQQHALFERSKAYLSGKGAAIPALQVAELRGLIRFHEWKYYIQNDPLISDFEFDQLFRQLGQIEKEYPELTDPDSPTQRVASDLSARGGGEAASGVNVRHLSPMLSLANSYDPEDLRDWDEQLKRLLNLPEDADVEYSVEPKFDGGSIALVYEGDALVRAATRGNGELGEEMTLNAREIGSIPHQAPFSKWGLHRVELRGDAIIRKDVFKRINEERADEGLTLFANPRNAATGSLRMKDPKEVGRRGLEAFIYTLGFAEDTSGTNRMGDFATHWESLDALAQLGFKVPEKERKVCKNIAGVIEFCKEWQERRDEYPYEIDGMVAKLNSRELQERAGFTAHHPRWAIAFKFQAKQATTTLLSVEYQVGKIGSITPVAKLSPVALAGVRVSSVSLHNEDFIRDKDLRTGDTVLVERAGDVIPYIVKALPELRKGEEQPIHFPEFCPVNDSAEPVRLVREEGEAAWRCPHCVCGAQDLQRLIFHVSKDAMDIEGLGKANVERFYDLGWLRSLPDVYRLDYERIANLEGFGKKSAANLRTAVEAAKKKPLYRLLHSLSIHHLGKKVSRLLAAKVGHVLELAEWKTEDFLDIRDVGPVVAENVMRFFQNPRNVKMLEEMEVLGVNLRQTPEDLPLSASPDAPLAGQTILFTGTLATMGRKEAQLKAEAAGAKVLSAVSANLNILVVGEEAGSKLKKARELGTVRILTEAEFAEIMDRT
ncbi:MAG: NAD-dependent DNA ligase LigA [Haliscomenobacter sp.]